jgi:hypothetical protein
MDLILDNWCEYFWYMLYDFLSNVHGLDLPVNQNEVWSFLKTLELVRPDIFKDIITRVESCITL